MMRTVDVFYLTLPVDSADQAVSLAEYLGRHGVDAAPDGVDAVSVPIERGESIVRTELVQVLVENWKLFWQHSDAELFGLPVLIKDYYGEGGCPACGAGPVVS